MGFALFECDISFLKAAFENGSIKKYDCYFSISRAYSSNNMFELSFTFYI